ncbi:threonine/homoserine/homoserine lactone efflux protein [Aquimarina sp. MAR_2010_214]|uniref:LysE family transporter n=1 Tax=Aquimarina sp. MAR_2010_214 TaxID=1250026 RepID=UPI000C7110DC|nr:LysE family transporter [Aquimarina sp. MAR_2010_214]PKV49505.1 threonine/homoserine/homoserine lactone efflux protein [Aquimarina sp. MAR_2010_214]
MTLPMLYLILGAITAIIGALPLGAVNLAVIHTSAKENIKNASYIALAAGIGEVLLALFALHCSMELSDFFQENQWIQIAFITLFFLIGIYFLLFKNKTNTKRTSNKLRLSNSKFLTGFSLAILNPPVIIYWVLAISLVNKYVFELTAQDPLTSLFLFFLGVYLGKIGTLYFYGRWGNKIAQQPGDSKAKLSKIVGIVLVVISIFQGINFFIQ